MVCIKICSPKLRYMWVYSLKRGNYMTIDYLEGLNNNNFESVQLKFKNKLKIISLFVELRDRTINVMQKFNNPHNY